MPASLPTGTPSLPPLGGRLFLFYRLAWFLSLALALGAVGFSWFDSATSGSVWALRMAKAVVLISVSAILFRRRATDAVAAMLALSFLLWTASSSVDFEQTGATWAALLDRCRFLLFALALLLFPDGEWYPRWTRHVAAAIVATFLLGIAEAGGLLETRLYLPLAISCVLLAIAALFASYRRASIRQQQQVKWIALGLVAGISLILSARGGAALTSGMVTPFIGTVLLEAMFQLGIIVLALGFLVSLLRFRLYDAEAAISRSATYAALSLALVATFTASEVFLEGLGQNYLGAEIGDLAGALAAGTAAMLLAPLHDRISRWAERFFQHELAVLKQELPDLLAALSAGTSVRRLADAVLPRIEQAVQSTRIGLLIDGRLVATQGINLSSARKLLKDWQPATTPELIGRNDEDPFPLHMTLRCPFGSVRGWLLLGPRPDGSFYGKDDVEALSAVAPSLQRALLQVAERERDERRRLADGRALRRAIQHVSERLSALERPS